MRRGFWGRVDLQRSAQIDGHPGGACDRATAAGEGQRWHAIEANRHLFRRDRDADRDATARPKTQRIDATRDLLPMTPVCRCGSLVRFLLVS